MPQPVSSASHAAVTLAFRRARNKFPKNFGYISCNVRTCHKNKKKYMPSHIVKNVHNYTTDNQNNNDDNSKYECREDLERNKRNEQERNLHHSIKSCKNCINQSLTSDDFKSCTKSNESLEKSVCEESGENFMAPETISTRRKLVNCYHHCNKSYHNAFSQKVHNWEHKVQNLKTITGKDLEESKLNSHGIHHFHCVHKNHNKVLLNSHYHRPSCRYRNSNTQVSVSHRLPYRCSHKIDSQQFPKRNTPETISEDDNQSDIVECNTLKHKDSMLILLEKLAINKKHCEEEYLKEKSKSQCSLFSHIVDFERTEENTEEEAVHEIRTN